jgi:hypothetical protein
MKDLQCSEKIEMKKYTLLSNKNVDIKFSGHDAFLEQPSSGMLKIDI